MHAHERTLLARLGFADPDRCDPLHDIACRYLATQAVFSRLAKFLGDAFQENNYESEDSVFETRSVASASVRVIRATHEAEISKGYGQYRTTVGFVDVLLATELIQNHTDVKKRPVRKKGDNESWQPCESFWRQCYADVAIEVKSNPLPIGDIIRQINLYRSYCSFDTWILATTYPLPQSQYDCLVNARILHIHLGQRFQDFVKEQANTPCSSSVEV